jgi:E3 ubiquitin-protein ligase TRIP12
MKADHGFTMDSQPVRDLISIMNEYDKPAKRRFLQFITGSPRLPIGGKHFDLSFPHRLSYEVSKGFRGLTPALTVVRKPNEPPLTPDDYLPSVMTCVNYLKLPRYSNKDVMKQKIKVAVDEGIHSGFHLS